MEQPSKLRRTDRSPIKLLTDVGFSMILLFLDSESLTRLLIIYEKNQHFKNLIVKSAFCKERLKMYSTSLIFVTFDTFDPHKKRDWSMYKLHELENSVDCNKRWLRDGLHLLRPHIISESYYSSNAENNKKIAEDLAKHIGRKTNLYYHYLDRAIHYYYLALEISPECISVLSDLSFILKSIPGKNKETEDVYKKFIQVVQDPKYTVSNTSEYNSELISGTYCSYGNFLHRFPEKKEEAKSAYRMCFKYCHNYLNKYAFDKMTDNLIQRIRTGGSNVHNEVNLVCDICLEFSPNDIRALEYKADVIKHYPNKFNEAIILYRQILQITPKDTRIMRILAETLLRYPNATELDCKEAIGLYKSCISRERGISKSNIMFRFAFFISQRESGYKEAIRVYRTFLKWTDSRTNSWLYIRSMYELACILAKTQRGKKEAKRLCEQYLEKEPNNKKALKLLEGLK